MIKVSPSSALALWLTATAACSTGQHPQEQGVAPGVVPASAADASSDAFAADMPPVPETAGPIAASPTAATAELPPHPAMPAPLEEPQPTEQTLASTVYRWLPGHWIWTGNQYEWQSGLWIYDLPGYELVPPRWSWNGYEWLFMDAGWVVPGSSRLVYRPTAVPREAPAELAFASATPPAPGLEAAEAELYVEASSYAVYSWPGYWIAPAIVYPIWHPYYHYHWHHQPGPHARPPLYHDGRYDYARQHAKPGKPHVEQRRQAWARSHVYRPSSQSAARPVVPDTLPDTVRTRTLRAEHLDPAALREPGRLDPTALQATPAQRAIRQQLETRRSAYGEPVRARPSHQNPGPKPPYRYAASPRRMQSGVLVRPSAIEAPQVSARPARERPAAAPPPRASRHYGQSSQPPASAMRSGSASGAAQPSSAVPSDPSAPRPPPATRPGAERPPGAPSYRTTAPPSATRPGAAGPRGVPSHGTTRAPSVGGPGASAYGARPSVPPPARQRGPGVSFPRATPANRPAPSTSRPGASGR